jgi:hypothetical protein
MLVILVYGVRIAAVINGCTVERLIHYSSILTGDNSYLIMWPAQKLQERESCTAHNTKPTMAFYDTDYLQLWCALQLATETASLFQIRRNIVGHSEVVNVEVVQTNEPVEEQKTKT